MASKSESTRMEDSVAVDQHDLRHERRLGGSELLDQRTSGRQLAKGQEARDVGDVDLVKLEVFIHCLHLRVLAHYQGSTHKLLVLRRKAQIHASNLHYLREPNERI